LFGNGAKALVGGPAGIAFDETFCASAGTDMMEDGHRESVKFTFCYIDEYLVVTFRTSEGDNCCELKIWFIQ